MKNFSPASKCVHKVEGSERENESRESSVNQAYLSQFLPSEPTLVLQTAVNAETYPLLGHSSLVSFGVETGQS